MVQQDWELWMAWWFTKFGNYRWSRGSAILGIIDDLMVQQDWELWMAWWFTKFGNYRWSRGSAILGIIDNLMVQQVWKILDGRGSTKQGGVVLWLSNVRCCGLMAQQSGVV